MKKNLIIIFLIILCSCGENENKQEQADTTPKVSEDGKIIFFPSKENIAFFPTEKVYKGNINAELNFPAKIAASIVASREGAYQNIILFDDPALAGNYTQLIQKQINVKEIRNVRIRQRKIELGRITDLHEHGAATGRDLLEAQTSLSIEEANLSNEKTAIIEYESILKAGGFNPETLLKGRVGTVYIICDVPENQIGEIQEGAACSIQFNSFPNQKFSGKVEDIADIVDNITRMVKLRIILNNETGKLKVGMFALVSFGVSESNYISINKNSLITVQGKNYVFVKVSPNTFERRQVGVGPQIGDRVIIYIGLQEGESVAVKGAMQLKGLSFGY